MLIGIPSEIRPGETRVAATPETVRKLSTGKVHTVIVQSGAGAGASIPDREFEIAGATIVATAAEIYAQADILLKMRAPEACETPMGRSGNGVIGLPAPHEPSVSEAPAPP